MDDKLDDSKPRDFLGEAARLALQLDPMAWEFDLSDRSQTPFQGKNVGPCLYISAVDSENACTGPQTSAFEYGTTLLVALPSSGPGHALLITFCQLMEVNRLCE